jgi:hypothetical protein
VSGDWSELNSLVFCVKQVEKTAVDVTEDADEIDGAFQLKPKMSVMCDVERYDAADVDKYLLGRS